jgi:hypothetical protein
VPETRRGFRRRTFGDASTESGLCGGVGEEEMFDDLLDAPSGWIAGWAKLSLISIEGAEG